MLDLILVIINTAVVAGLFWIGYAQQRDRADSGIGPVLVLITFCVPLALITVVIGLAAVIQNEGRLPGSIALAVSSAALLFLVIGFLNSQVF